MSRPRKVRPITSAEVLQFIEGATQEMLEILGQLIEKRIAQLKEVK